MRPNLKEEGLQVWVQSRRFTERKIVKTLFGDMNTLREQPSRRNNKSRKDETIGATVQILCPHAATDSAMP
jgi:hypothetical protein